MKPIQTYIDTARSLAQLVAAVADQIENKRRIPTEVSSEIIDAGFFRLLLPASLGGAELSHPDFLQIIRIFAEADASVAWCINQNNVFSTNAVRVSEATAQRVWGDKRTVVSNGPPGPQNRAVSSGNGDYVLSGRWNFSSGITHANWVAALAPVYTENQMKPNEMRTFLIPIEDVRIVDEWQVGGLRGTGSLGFEAVGLRVPGCLSYEASEPSREPGMLYLIDTTPMFASGFATVALGATRAGLDSAIATAQRKTQQGQSQTLREETATQRTIGEAEAIWNSARAFLQEATDSMWNAVSVHGELNTDQRIMVRLASTHAIRKSAEVVDAAYSICGSDAIFTANPVHRRFQDVHAITQQIQGRMTHYDTAGQHYLGLEPKGIF